jgi:catechol 2,3-dioxygenase-like lactoylglutathione lyase family enzyme
MKRTALFLACFLVVISLGESAAQFGKHKPPKRPRLLGIAGVTLLVGDVEAAHHYYRDLIDPAHSCSYCDGENLPAQFLFLPSGQRIHFEKIPTPAPADLLAEVSFLTDDLEGYKRYLDFHKVDFNTRKRKSGGDIVSLLLTDPEGHHVAITDAYSLANSEGLNVGLPPGNFKNPVRIIHAGFVVNNREAINQFYVELLGFRPYWHGGMKDDKDDWVAMQVPDGTDWVEYMLNIPATADKQTLGVMNHIALGVPDIHAIADKLTAAGVKATETPKIGRDGKYQLNLYDAQLTRIEFMEFKPVEKPCCSEFTGPHPDPEHPAPPAPTPLSQP